MAADLAELKKFCKDKSQTLKWDALLNSQNVSHYLNFEQ
jgi:hypothetical protein